MEREKQLRFSEICRANGWKCTSQRLAIYDCVHENRTHPDVDMIWAETRKLLPTITRESVYRILNEFVDKGLLLRLDKIDHARYDGATAPHGHYICERCGTISDLEIPGLGEWGKLRPAGNIRHIELRIGGICEDCQRSNRPEQKNKEK